MQLLCAYESKHICGWATAFFVNVNITQYIYLGCKNSLNILYMELTLFGKLFTMFILNSNIS